MNIFLGKVRNLNPSPVWLNRRARMKCFRHNNATNYYEYIAIGYGLPAKWLSQ